MSLLKDSSIFKSSGQLLLASPSASLQFIKQDNHFGSQNYFLRPSSRGSVHPRQILIQQSQQNHTAQQQQVQEKTSFLPQLSQQQNLNNSQPQLVASRKNSLIAKNMSTEQLKDWLIGKQPSQQNLLQGEKNQNQASIKGNHSLIQIGSSSKKQDFFNGDKKTDINNTQEQSTIQNQDNQQINQIQERGIIRRTQRRAQSDIIYQRQPDVSNSNQVQTIIQNTQQKNQNEQNSDEKQKNEENEQKTQAKIIVRKRHRMPSYNPTNPQNFDQHSLQNQQNNLQNQQLESQQSNQMLQNFIQTDNHKSVEFTKQQPSPLIEENFRSTLNMFQSPNKNNRVGFSSAEPSPIKKPASMTSLMENSSTGFHKFQIKNLVNSNYSNTVTIPQSQSTKNLTQRQILLKDLQNITDSRKLLEISSNNAPLNSKLGNSQTFQHDQLNQQLGKKLTIFNSPNSSSSSPLDEMLSTANSSSSQQNLPLIKNRQIKNSSLQHIEMPQKLQIHSTTSKSSVIQNMWGSSSNLDQTSEQSQIQPKGILKNKRDSSKVKKQVAFDRNLHIFELGQDQQS
ncbi:hypothetical protein TTHERM_00540240 (macronuclear) [Tetrahymena thermophila SB210]|uniref:Uncharacterized protein n=1 Tax=Tetrahymena thermophila (strain SB210) TaxID=312017 RepID=I7M0J3_TETTS|nr:hypothetical protein TTHERM_00540240 [Tetrahymena thermophila SB210]EAR87704.1 hypothetical protein TTHERM_00540240 [Tetrahymena thermophila SB210]|eukprot:XP_001007949.1 hypothetical protein TTHERM_00540240 [Tetrahymena thermophila SB210]